MRTGPTSQVPFMRPDYDKAFNSNKPASQSGPDDYARAQAQKEAQDRRAAAADRQKQAQADAAFRRSQQQADAARRVFDRNTTAEVRTYEAAQRAKAKADADLQRARERNARDQERLERRQAADRERVMRFERSQEYGDARSIDSTRTRRIREEARLGQHFEALRYRAGRTLSPGSYEGIQRQASLLRGRAASYQSQYGMAPSGLGGMGGVLAGMGSHSNTYATQNIVGLGARGQRAADGREWIGLARIEQELRRIERVNVAILSNDLKSTAEQRANAARNLTAVGEARQRIGAGRAGSSGLRNAYGSVVGGAGLLLSNPIVDAGLAATVGLATSPFLISGALNKAVSLSKPYYNLRESTAGIGRAGDFNSRDLLGRLLPNSGGSPSWMKAQGITTSMATGILGDYGIAPRSASEAVGIIRDVRSASLSRFMGLGDSQLAGSAKLARTLGITGLGEGAGGVGAVTAVPGGFSGSVSATSDRSQYFATLQKVMASATAQGLDHADSLKTVESLLRSSAGAGAATVNGGALSGFWNRMTTSGLPGMRSGEGVVSALSGINQAFGQIGVGGAPAQNVMMMSYFGRNGGMPKSEGALQKFLGMSNQDWSAMMSNPGQKQMVQNYLGAADKNPAIALTYLQPFLQGRPDLMNQVFEGSAFGGTNPMLKPLLKGNVTGAGYAGGVAMSVGSGLGAIPGDQAASMRDRLAKRLNISAEAAAGLVGNFMAESGGVGGLPEKGGGGIGIAQWTGPRRTAYEAFRRAHPELDADEADLQFAMSELGPGGAYSGVTKQLQAPGMNYAQASDIVLKQYENPRNQSAAEIARRQTASGRVAALPSGSDNVPTDVYGPTVNADQAAIGASRYAANTVGAAAGSPAGDAAVAFSQGVDRAAIALEGFVTALVNGTQALKNKNMNSALPGGDSMRWMDPSGMNYMFQIPGAGAPARP